MPQKEETWTEKDQSYLDFLAVMHDVENLSNPSGLNWSYDRF